MREADSHRALLSYIYMMYRVSKFWGRGRHTRADELACLIVVMRYDMPIVVSTCDQWPWNSANVMRLRITGISLATVAVLKDSGLLYQGVQDSLTLVLWRKLVLGAYDCGWFKSVVEL